LKYYRLLILAFTLFACSESEDPKSSAKLILKFDFLATTPNATGTISEADKTIAINVSETNSLTNLAPTIKISDKATISPASGVPTNFTNPVKYTVTAEDGTTQDYIVTVTTKSADKSILSFTFTALDKEITATIDESTKSITASAPYGIISVKPIITTSEKASVSPASEAAVDLSNPVKYTVTAEDGSTQEYTLKVEIPKTFVVDPPTITTIELDEVFEFHGQFGDMSNFKTYLIDFTNVSTNEVVPEHSVLGSTSSILYIKLFDVPVGYYKINIHISDQSQTLSETFFVDYHTPEIESVDHTTIAAGEEILILGNHFMDTGNAVKLGTTDLTIVGQQSNGIRVKVPSSLTPGEYI
jgi:hypothetical protein